MKARADKFIKTIRGPLATVHVCTICGQHWTAPKGDYLSTRAYGAARTHVAIDHPQRSAP